MIGWKRLYPKPAGSLPGGIVTQWGVALITVLILVFVAIWLATGGSSPAEIDSIGGEVTGPARNFAGQMAAQVEAEALRAETRRPLGSELLGRQFLLIGKEIIMHLPVLALLTGTGGGLGRLESVGVNGFQGKIHEDELDLPRLDVFGCQLGDRLTDVSAAIRSLVV